MNTDWFCEDHNQLEFQTFCCRIVGNTDISLQFLNVLNFCDICLLLS